MTHKVGDTVLSTCNINGVKAGATLELVKYRPEGWNKAKELTGKGPVVKMGQGGRPKPEHWVAKFISGDVKATRLRPDAELPEKTVIVFANMIEAAPN